MKITGSQIIARVKFATLYAIAYLDRKGNTKQWHMVSRKETPRCMTGDITRPDAAIIVPYHRKTGQLAVIREYRIPVGGWQYGFPAGLLDPEEDLVQAAGRELREETGLDLVKVYRHSPAIFSSAGITDEAIAMVFAEVDGVASTRHNEDSEQIDIYMMDREAVGDLLKRSDIVFGARAWIAMDAFVRMGEAYLTGA